MKSKEEMAEAHADKGFERNTMDAWELGKHDFLAGWAECEKQMQAKLAVAVEALGEAQMHLDQIAGRLKNTKFFHIYSTIGYVRHTVIPAIGEALAKIQGGEAND